MEWTSVTTAVTSFNRYMVECEFRWVSRRRLLNTVLIDTWWNVNMYDLSNAYFTDSGFNRYMVECEFRKARL